MTKIDPAVSKHMSELAKKRKNPYFGFKDPKLAKKAGDIGRETQRINREEAAKAKDTTKSEDQSQG